MTIASKLGGNAGFLLRHRPHQRLLTMAHQCKRIAFSDLVRAVASSSARDSLARYAMYIVELQTLGLVWVEKDSENRRFVGATSTGVNALARLRSYERLV